MPTTVQIATTDEGGLQLHGNELELYDRTGHDPVAIRLRSGNGGIGKVSFDYPSANGWTELGYIFAKKDERFPTDPTIEFECWKSGSADADAERLFAVRVDGVVFYKGSGGPSPRVTRFYTDGGKFLINYQDDQDNVRAVIYRVFYKPDGSEDHIEFVGERTLWP